MAWLKNIASLWIWPAIAAVAGLAFSAVVASKNVEIANLKAVNAERLSIINAQAADAQRAAREHVTRIADKERELGTLIATNAQKDDREQQAHQTRLAAAAAVERSLRDQLSTIASAYAERRDAAIAAADAASHLAPAATTIGVLTELYQRCDERTGKIAAFADAAHAAGQRCQRDYDAVRAATMNVLATPAIAPQ